MVKRASTFWLLLNEFHWSSNLTVIRCGHCQRLKPTWQELGSTIQKNVNEKVIIAEVDCTTATALCSEQDVTGYPT